VFGLPLRSILIAIANHSIWYVAVCACNPFGVSVARLTGLLMIPFIWSYCLTIGRCFATGGKRYYLVLFLFLLAPRLTICEFCLEDDW
jgi:hypothetical protein